MIELSKIKKEENKNLIDELYTMEILKLNGIDI